MDQRESCLRRLQVQLPGELNENNVQQLRLSDDIEKFGPKERSFRQEAHCPNPSQTLMKEPRKKPDFLHMNHMRINVGLTRHWSDIGVMCFCYLRLFYVFICPVIDVVATKKEESTLPSGEKHNVRLNFCCGWIECDNYKIHTVYNVICIKLKCKSFPQVLWPVFTSLHWRNILFTLIASVNEL